MNPDSTNVFQEQINQLMDKARVAEFPEKFLREVLDSPDKFIDYHNGTIKKLAQTQIDLSAQKQSETASFALSLKEKFYLTDLNAVVQTGFITLGEEKCRIICTDDGLYVNLNELNDLLGYATPSFGKSVRASALSLKEILNLLKPTKLDAKNTASYTSLPSAQMLGNKELPLKYLSVIEVRASIKDVLKPIAKQFGEWFEIFIQKSMVDIPILNKYDKPSSTEASPLKGEKSECNPITKKRTPARINYDDKTRVSDPQMTKVASDFMKRIHNFDNGRVFYIIYLFSVNSDDDTRHHIFKYGYSDAGIFERLSEHQKKLHDAAVPVFAIANDNPKDIETTFGKTMTARGWEHQLSGPGGTECIKVPADSWEIIIAIVNDLVGYSRAGEQLAIAQEKTKQMQILQEMMNKLPEADRLDAMKMFMGQRQ